VGALEKKKPQKTKPPVKPRRSKKGKIRHVWLNVLPDDLWLTIPEGETVWEALREADVKLESDCGGFQKCGKCKIKVISPIAPPTKIEQELISKEELEQGIRLACRTKVTHDSAISTGEPVVETEYHKILTTSHVIPARYIAVAQLEPLVYKRLITLPHDAQNEGLSDLDWIKQGLGAEYSDLKASLHCLRTLPQTLKETQFSGAAVLHDNFLLAWQNWQEGEHGYGLVFDLGTSTLVGKLVSLVNGRELAVASRLNSQSRHGSDVISRLHYVKQRPTGLQTFHYLLVKDLNNLTKHLLTTSGLKQSDIFVAVAAGNTTMEHFLLDLPPTAIAEAPFSPVVTDGMIVNAADVGLELNPAALLYTMPMKAGYIGGDLISFVLNSGVSEQDEEIILGLDLGTNGEIFLGNSKRLLTCSAAAGPALEGARISSGMIAKAGAIEGVSLKEGDLHYRIIGNIKPKGVCGSGLVDLVAVLLHCGVIDHEGLIRPPQGRAYRNLRSRVIRQTNGYDFLIASEEESFHRRPIYLTQKDVRELQLAKAAIAAGVNTLMDELSLGVEGINRIYLAGALGNYADRISTLRIGLLPKVELELISSLGNAASMGASMVLLSKKYWQMAKDVVDFIEHIELSYRRDFNQYFVEHMDFPEENLW